jgi:hypothetical protein
MKQKVVFILPMGKLSMFHFEISIGKLRQCVHFAYMGCLMEILAYIFFCTVF